METVIIGGGKGCYSLLDLTRGSFLQERSITVLGVVDINWAAPGMLYAKSIGLATFSDIKEALEDIVPELIIELTGSNLVLQELYSLLRPGMKIIDHTIARLFWDLGKARDKMKDQNEELQALKIKLENERLFLQNIFDSLSDLAIVIDKNHRILRVNQNFAEFIGIEPEQAIMQIFRTLIENSEIRFGQKKERIMLDDAWNTCQAITTLKLAPAPSENYWKITVMPICNQHAQTKSLIITWHLITDKIMLRHQIESSELRFRSFINSAQDWISIKDLDGRYIITNTAVAHSFGKEPNDFVGKHPDEIFPPQLAHTIEQHDTRVIATRKAHTFEEKIDVNGKIHFFQTVRFPLFDYKGELSGICTMARDVSKEKHLHDQLVHNEKLAALGKLAAGIAHEINNPLTGVLAYAEDIREESDNEDLTSDIDVIIRETLRCRDIVKNLLDFAKQDKPQLEIYQFNEVVNNTLLLVNRLPQFRDIHIRTKLIDHLPNVRLDPRQIQQVVLNLMLNAADAMKSKGEIFIHTEFCAHSCQCKLNVQDSGPGIPENLIDKIFEPFFSTKETNGLGLAVSWGIVEFHGGTIEIDMAPEQGAIFSIVLPAYIEN